MRVYDEVSVAAESCHPLEFVDGLVGAHPSGGGRGESFAGVLVGDREDPDRPPVVGLVLEEVDRPHVVGVSGCDMTGHPPSPSSLARFDREAQSLISPQALDTLSVAYPALPAQEHVDPPIPVAGMLAGEQPQPLAQPVLLGHRATLVALA